MRRNFLFLIAVFALGFLAYLGVAALEWLGIVPKNQVLPKVEFVLDWTPNTNHTGLFVALEKGYFEKEGIDFKIVLAPEDSSSDLVINGKVPFGISFQDSIALKLSKGAPVTAVAAILENNTSGILSTKVSGILSPKDLEYKKYGTWDDPMEKAVLQSVMAKENASFDNVELVPNTDFNSVVSLSNGNFESAWIFYGWDGVMAKHQGLETNYFYFKDYAPELNYYTPIIIVNNDYLANKPHLVKKVMRAIQKGYQYAIEHPEESAEILMDYAPELREDEAFVLQSQKYLSEQYAPSGKAKWGQFEAERWNAFFTWAKEQGLIETAIPENYGFTNEYLGD